ncbi:hypothetical protein EI42_01025 [Thermosporothrix hazakensis]|uniref:Uncharacterized protein n=1 Tax=Thermosporothrix hazakensis TaxID=644383 RepID=A0A326USK2_THEHA|nr:hypothetical protein EI42_01025 [Thermosporothrix hazakensis]
MTFCMGDVVFLVKSHPFDMGCDPPLWSHSNGEKRTALCTEAPLLMFLLILAMREVLSFELLKFCPDSLYLLFHCGKHRLSLLQPFRTL